MKILGGIGKYLYIVWLIIFSSIISGCIANKQVPDLGPTLQEVIDKTNFENTQIIKDQIVNQISDSIIFSKLKNPTRFRVTKKIDWTIITTDDLLLYGIDINDDISKNKHIVDVNVSINSIKNGGYINIIWQIWFEDNINTSSGIIIRLDSIDYNISWSSYLKKQIFIINMVEAFVWRWWISLDNLGSNKISILYPEKIREQIKPYITIDSDNFKIILDTDLIKKDMSDSILSRVKNFDGTYISNHINKAEIKINNIDINNKSYYWYIAPDSLWLNYDGESNKESASYLYKRSSDWTSWYSEYIALETTKWDTKTNFEFSESQALDANTMNLNATSINFQYKINGFGKVDTFIIGNWVWKISPSQDQFLRPSEIKSIRDILGQVEIKSRE